MSDESIISIPLGAGLDETAEDAFVMAPAMRQAINVVFPDGNSCKKRNGFSLAYSGAYLRKLIKRGSEALVTDGINLIPTASPNASRGRVSGCMLSRSLFGSGNWQTSFAVTTRLCPRGSVAEDKSVANGGTGLQVRVWCDGKAVLSQIVDPATGNVLVTATLDSAAGALLTTPLAQPRVVIVGSVAFAIYAASTFTVAKYRALDLTAIGGSWTAAALITGVQFNSAADVWDACDVTGTSLIAILESSTGADATKPFLSTYTAAGTTLTLAANATIETIGSTPSWTSAAICADSTEGIVVAYAYDTTSAGTVTSTIRWAAYTAALGVTQAATLLHASAYTVASKASKERQMYALGIVRSGVGSGNSAQYVVTWASRYTAWMNLTSGIGGTDVTRDIPALFQFIVKKTTAIVVAGRSPIWGFQTLSKPFAMTVNAATRIYVVGMFVDGVRGTQSEAPVTNGTPTIVLLDLDYASATSANYIPVPVAVAAPGFAGAPSPMNMDVAVRGVGTGATFIGTEEDNAGTTSITALFADWKAPGLWQSVELGAWTWIAGGLPVIYDGSVTTEVGFIHPPPKPLVIAQSGSGPPLVTTNQTMQVIAQYAQTDTNGNVHRSAPSQPSDPIDCSADAQLIRIGVFSTRCTLRQVGNTSTGDIGGNPVRVELYRNTTTTPDVWQLFAIVANDPTASSYLTVDSDVTDNEIAANPFLSTTGGVVESSCAPNLSSFTVHANRVIGTDEDGRTMWFTTDLLPGEAPRFSTSFTLDWPEGPITAAWSIDQKLHAATETSGSIWYVLGNGPAPTGAGSDWTTPERWQPGLGVVDQNGVGTFEKGVVLSTPKGVYLQGRDGSFVWLGEKFRRTLATYPVVVGVTPLTGDGVVKIALSAAYGESQSGLTVHWDHRQGRFSTHIVGGVGSQAWASTASIGGVFYALLNAGAQGAVYFEDETTSLDAGAWVTSQLRLGWIAAGSGGMQSAQECMSANVLLGYQTAHGIQISYARDYRSSFDSPAIAWTEAQTLAFASASAGVEQLRASPAIQTTEAISMQIADSQPLVLGTGRGCAFLHASLSVRTKRGPWMQLVAGASQ